MAKSKKNQQMKLISGQKRKHFYLKKPFFAKNAQV